MQGIGAVTAAGNLIPDILPVGPNPQATPVQNDETLAIDDGMKWMVDFGEAERLGMAAASAAAADCSGTATHQFAPRVRCEEIARQRRVGDAAQGIDRSPQIH